jgi:predicted amidohydrolase
LGCLICYDIFFPEVCKTYALKGAEMLVCISAGPTASMEFFEKVMFARAIENTTFFLFCNLTGSESSMIYFGGSTIIGPRGDLKATGGHLIEQIVKTEIDLEELKIARRFRPTLRNTRSEILEQLAYPDTIRPKG